MAFGPKVTFLIKSLVEGGFIGFSFADSNDADNINLLVKKYSPSLKEVDRY